MALSFTDYVFYLNTHLSLLYYTGIKSKIITTNTTLNGFKKASLEVKVKCRDFYLDHPDIIKDFLKDKQAELTHDQRKLIQGFDKMVKGRFVVAKELTHHAIFISADKANNVYAVSPLSTRFSEMFYVPGLVEAVLIPFKDKIIYDGMVKGAVGFGPGMKSTYIEIYKNAKLNNQIITSL